MKPHHVPHRDNFLQMQLALERPLFNKMHEIKNHYIKACASEYEANKNRQFVHETRALNKQVFLALSNHYAKVIPLFGTHALNQLKSTRLLLDFKSQQNLYSKLTQKWIKENGLQSTDDITDTSRADILAVIAAGEEDGDSALSIAGDIRDLTDYTPWRAQTIAVTETHNAATFGSIETMRDTATSYNITMLKFWVPIIDDRTREAHADMDDSEGIALDDTFTVAGEEMDRPGDPSGSAENTINCRCALTYEEDQSAFDDGSSDVNVDESGAGDLLGSDGDSGDGGDE